MSVRNVTRFGADPLEDLEVANKRYVDASGGTAGISILKEVTQTKNQDTTLALDDELFFDVKAGKSYVVLAMMRTTGHASADLKDTWQVPSGTTGTWTEQGTTFAANHDDISAVDWQSTTALGNGEVMQFLAQVKITTDGVMGFMWAQQTNFDGDVSVMSGSVLQVWESDT